MNSTPGIKTVTLVALLLLTGTLARAQDKGHLIGRIADQGGGAIEKTQIVAEGPSGKFQTISNENGEYDFELPAGVYQLRTMKVLGFLPFQRSRVRVEAGKVRTLNIALKVNSKDAICILPLIGTPIPKTETQRKKQR